jgi:hypothetical protein
MKFQVFWDMTTCQLVNSYRHIREIYCIYIQGQAVQEELQFLANWQSVLSQKALNFEVSPKQKQTMIPSSNTAQFLERMSYSSSLIFI